MAASMVDLREFYLSPTAMALAVPPEVVARWSGKKAAQQALVTKGAAAGNVLVLVDTDEWYPVYEAKVLKERMVNDYALTYQTIMEVPGDALVRWRTVFDDFAAVQEEIRALAGVDE